MNVLSPARSIFAPRALLALVLAGACTSSLAAGGLERAQQRKQLVAGIGYVVPEYKGGMKFRTADAIDSELLQDLARRLQVPFTAARTTPGRHAALLASGKTDVVLAAIADDDPAHHNTTVIPVGYAAAPMAIMRTDTDIKSWEQLKGRKVCLSEGGLYVGTLTAKYGAIEKVQRAPADSLLAVRIGECDAAVHDSAMLEELIKLPEWKKFSARLPPGPAATLAFLAPTKDVKKAGYLRRVVQDWNAGRYPEQLVKKAVRHIAFEVYLDQNVPDCH